MLEPITLRVFAEADRSDVQARAADQAKADPERFLRAYVAHPESFGGRYVCTDLMKETFADYAASREARGRYNAPVHNPAAVLAAEQFRRTLAAARPSERDTAVFLTGMPGAGKTSRVLQAGDLSPSFQLVYEGQLNSPDATRAKVGGALDAGLRPLILAVLPRPETALQNTFTRFDTVGRGASINVMASIQEGLADALKRLDRDFGSRIDIRVMDVRDQARPLALEGKRGILEIEKELSNGSVALRLQAALEQHRRAGSITEDCYRQAIGEAPRALDRGVAGSLSAIGRDPGDRSEGPRGAEQAPVLKAADAAKAAHFLSLSRAQALTSDVPAFRDAWAQLDLVRAAAANRHPNDPAKSERQVEAARQQIADNFRQGREIVPATVDAVKPPRVPDRER